MDAEFGGGSLAERNRAGAGIDNEVDGAAVDPRLDLEAAAVVARS